MRRIWSEGHKIMAEASDGESTVVAEVVGSFVQGGLVETAEFIATACNNQTDIDKIITLLQIRVKQWMGIQL